MDMFQHSQSTLEMSDPEHSGTAFRAIFSNQVYTGPGGRLIAPLGRFRFFIDLVGYEGMYVLREEIGSAESLPLTQGTFTWCLSYAQDIVRERTQDPTPMEV